MFNFKKKIVNPLVRAALSEIDVAFKVEGAEARVEKLLSVDEMVKSEFVKARNTQVQASNVYIGVAMLGFIVTALGLVVGGGIALAGLGMAAGGFAASTKFGANADRLTSDRNTLREIIGTEVARISEESPAEAIKSPRFLRSIAAAFKSVAKNELKGTPEALRARVAFKPETPTA